MVGATLCEDAEALLQELEWVLSPVGLDLETTGCNPEEETPWGNAIPLLMSLCWRDEEGELQTHVVHRDDIPHFKSWLENDRYAKVGHNLAHFDRAALHNIGIDLRGIYGDTLVMSRLLDPGALTHGLKEWGVRLGYEVMDKVKAVSRPRHSKTPKVYKKTQTVRRNGIPHHYTEGAEVYEINWDSSELMPFDYVWDNYPGRRQAVAEYAAQDAVLHLALFEHLQAHQVEVLW